MTRAPLSTRTMERLAFVRALFEQGVHQSMQLEPWAGASVMSFQDAIELFLVLSADHLDQPLERNDPFYKYFRKVNTALSARGASLSEYRAMERVNGVRVNLKHNGHMPGGIELRQARKDTAAFLNKNTPIIFSIEFDEIDLLTLVPQDPIREHIKEASRAAETSELESAMIILTRAFRELLTSHLQFPGLFFGNRKQLSGPWWDIEEISGKPGLVLQP